MAEEMPRGRIPIGLWLVVFGGLLLAGLGYLGMRNLIGGVVLTPPPIVGEWRAYRTPWRMTFNEDKTLVSSTGPEKADDSQPWKSTAGTYRIDYFGTLWVTLDSDKTYTATLRPDWPNQFDLVDAATDAVTVFQRVYQLPTMPGDVPRRTPSGD